jgi:very-short-patch-repair endonuclease
VCTKARLVVEVDWGVHLKRAQLDAHRDSIPAALVTSNLEATVALIRDVLAT